MKVIHHSVAAEMWWYKKPTIWNWFECRNHAKLSLCRPLQEMLVPSKLRSHHRRMHQSTRPHRRTYQVRIPQSLHSAELGEPKSRKMRKRQRMGEGKEEMDRGEDKVVAEDNERSQRLNLNLNHNHHLNKSLESPTMTMSTWDILKRSLEALQDETTPSMLREDIWGVSTRWVSYHRGDSCLLLSRTKTWAFMIRTRMIPWSFQLP